MMTGTRLNADGVEHRPSIEFGQVDVKQNQVGQMNDRRERRLPSSPPRPRPLAPRYFISSSLDRASSSTTRIFIRRSLLAP
jgi:hypothetical protein